MELTVAGKPVYLYTGGTELDAARRVVMLLHGAGHDHSVWTSTARHLARHGFAVAAPDLPGHGRSAGPALDSIERMAEWTMALMDALPAATAALAGHSMGSLITLQAAALCPARISALALLGTALPMPVADSLLRDAHDNRDSAHAMINRWSYAPVFHFSGGPTAGNWPTGVNRRLMERQQTGVLFTDLAACNNYAYADGFAAASLLTCPALVVSGERDQMTPRRAVLPLLETLARTPGGVCEKIIAGAGHALMAEAPGIINDTLRAFLSR